MRRFALLLALPLSLSVAQSVQAGDWCNLKRCYSSCRAEAQMNRLWPSMYTPADREAVYTALDMMVVSGWRTQNTLNDYHFDEQSSELNEVGRLKVRDILHDAPPEFRTVWVLRAHQDELTRKRMQSVHKVAGTFLPAGSIADVMETGDRPRTSPAQYIDLTDRNFIESMPPPRLPAMTMDVGN